MRTPHETVVLITGATAGIGLQTATELVEAGYKVIIHGRLSQRTEQAAATIREATGSEVHGQVAFDLSSLAAITEGASEIRERWPSIHVLLNNAGVYMDSRRLSKDGFELTFAVNHLAPFALTLHLKDVLQASAPARVVTVASLAHYRAELDLDMVATANGRFSGYGAYSDSKLANVLFAAALSRRFEGSGVSSNSLHPGVIDTKLLRAGFSIQGSPVETGANTTRYVATSSECEGVSGRYFSEAREARPTERARDTGLQERLWELSEELTGCRWA